jgi:glycosyltransferase involved in cell wall biosynthesis
MANVLICESGSGNGGSASYLYSFLQHLDKVAFNPIVLFSHKTDGAFINRISDLGIGINFLSTKEEIFPSKYSDIRFIKYIQILFNTLKNNYKPIVRLIYIIKKRKIDLILLNQDVVFHFPAILASAITQVPCIVRKGGVGIHQGKKLWHFLARFPTVFIASSHAEYRFHVESGFPYKKMVVIFEGVDVDAFCPGSDWKKIRKEFDIPFDMPIIGSISRIVEGKGHEDFIAAASLVLKEFPQASFLIVGDGEESRMQKLLDQARSLGIQDKVIFTGWRKDTTDILNAIDIFVHCPNLWREGMGIATLEALACGKPVVITDNWGLSDTTQDGYNGFSEPIGAIDQIADKILVLLKDKDLRTRMGLNSRVRALDLFDLRKNIKLIENIMHEVLSSKGV